MLIRAIAIMLFIPEAQTLKDKRQVLQSLISRVRNKFNVSIAEVDHQDQWQRATLGIAFVSNQKSHLDSIQQEILDLVESQYPVEITEMTVSEY
jgi:uncharacterized protein